MKKSVLPVLFKFANANYVKIPILAWTMQRSYIIKKSDFETETEEYKVTVSEQYMVSRWNVVIIGIYAAKKTTWYVILDRSR